MSAAPRVVLCDIDGVVWLGGRALPGAPEAVARMRSSGSRVLFVTNNSSATLAMHERALAEIAIPAAGDVVSSATAAAGLVEPGSRVLVCGGPGVVEALERRRTTVVHVGEEAVAGHVDAVVVGFHREFDYEEMRVASAAVRAGARLIATNGDATYPTPDGPIPGGGAIVAGIAVAAGVDPLVAGKPHEPMVTAVLDALGGDLASLTAAVMVGDRLETDGAFAVALGCRFALVRTGITTPGAPLPAGVVPDLDVADLAAVASRLAD